MGGRAAVVTVEAAQRGELCPAHDGANRRALEVWQASRWRALAVAVRRSAAAKDKRSLESRLSHLDQTAVCERATVRTKRANDSSHSLGMSRSTCIQGISRVSQKLSGPFSRSRR